MRTCRRGSSTCFLEVELEPYSTAQPAKRRALTALFELDEAGDERLRDAEAGVLLRPLQQLRRNVRRDLLDRVAHVGSVGYGRNQSRIWSTSQRRSRRPSALFGRTSAR